MFGWIHESIRQLILRKYGQEAWRRILSIANFEEGMESKINHYYRDEETYRLVNAVGSVIGIPVEEVWEAYGGFLIQFTMETGWDELLRALASDIKGFLDNLDALHYFIDHVVYKAKLKGPSFRCDACDDGTLTLHYYSKRSGLYPIVKGVVREIARQIFDVDILMKVAERKQESIDATDGEMEEHVVFKISEIARSGRHQAIINRGTLSLLSDYYTASLQLTPKDFTMIFPYHICIDKQLTIEHCGVYVKKSFPFLMTQESTLSDVLEIIHPEIPMSYDNFIHFINGTFVFKLKQFGEISPDRSNKSVYLKGQMLMLENNRHILYVCSPYVTTVRELLDRRLHLGDIPLYDATRDLILLNQSRMSQVELNRKLEETTKEMKLVAVQLETEKQKTDNLLKELLPASVADALRHGKEVEAGEFSEASVLFADIVSFTNICSQCRPIDVVQLLNDLYSRFDRLSSLNGVYKVETIGDAYMVVGGVPEYVENHAEKICNMAFGVLWEAKAVKEPVTGKSLQVRIGVHTGPVVAGVVGKKMPRYCLFGDTVNVANKLENNGLPGKIQLSTDAYKAASRCGSFLFQDRGYVEIKGKGQMYTYFLLKNNRKSLWEIVCRPRTEECTIDGYSELHESEQLRNASNTSTPELDRANKHLMDKLEKAEKTPGKKHPPREPKQPEKSSRTKPEELEKQASTVSTRPAAPIPHVVIGTGSYPSDAEREKTNTEETNIPAAEEEEEVVIPSTKQSAKLCSFTSKLCNVL